MECRSFDNITTRTLFSCHHCYQHVRRRSTVTAAFWICHNTPLQKLQRIYWFIVKTFSSATLHFVYTLYIRKPSLDIHPGFKGKQCRMHSHPLWYFNNNFSFVSTWFCRNTNTICNLEFHQVIVGDCWWLLVIACSLVLTSRTNNGSVTTVVAVHHGFIVGIWLEFLKSYFELLSWTYLRSQ